MRPVGAKGPAVRGPWVSGARHETSRSEAPARAIGREMLAISDQEPFASLTTIELEEEILRESIRYGRHGEAVARFLRAAGQLGLELSRSRGETMSVLLAHHLGYGREPGEGCPAGRARAFARMKRTRLLGELGLPEEPWLVRVLGRVCFADLLLPGDLRSLCAALEDRKARAWLAHLETISPASLRVLGDPERRRAATFSLLVELGTGARDCEEPTRSHEHILRVLDSVIGLIRLLYPGQRLPRIRGIDELLKTHRDLLVRHSAWQNLPLVTRHSLSHPFQGQTPSSRSGAHKISAARGPSAATALARTISA